MIVYYYLNYKEFVYKFPIFRLIFLGTEKQFYANWIIKSEELTQFGWNQNESKIQWHLFIDFNEIFKIFFPQKITDVCDWWFKYHSDQFLIWKILGDTIFGIINTSKMVWCKPCWAYWFNSHG